jgi:uncharacterized protein YxeA
MKKLLIILVIALAAIASYTANSNAEKIDYNSARLERFADGIKYDRETKTIYTKGKLARWSVQRAERAYKESGDREFWLDNNLTSNYKCVKVEKIVYGK